MIWWGIFIGMIIGVNAGVVVMGAICAQARDADKEVQEPGPWEKTSARAVRVPPTRH